MLSGTIEDRGHFCRVGRADPSPNSLRHQVGSCALEAGWRPIGVADDGTITGLDDDYATLSKGNRDGYELFLTQLIADKLSGPSPSLCRISFDASDGKDVCRVEVAASSKPVFASPMNSKSHTDFWVRQGNKTEQFHASEMIDYSQDHWG